MPNISNRYFYICILFSLSAVVFGDPADETLNQLKVKLANLEHTQCEFEQITFDENDAVANSSKGIYYFGSEKKLKMEFTNGENEGLIVFIKNGETIYKDTTLETLITKSFIENESTDPLTLLFSDANIEDIPASLSITKNKEENSFIVTGTNDLVDSFGFNLSFQNGFIHHLNWHSDFVKMNTDFTNCKLGKQHERFFDIGDVENYDTHGTQ